MYKHAVVCLQFDYTACCQFQIFRLTFSLF